jgi:hypothetical protein
LLEKTIGLYHELNIYKEYDKQDQQGKAAFIERNPHMTQQQEPVARSPDGSQTKKGQGTRQNTDRLITKMINNLLLIRKSKKKKMIE